MERKRILISYGDIRGFGTWVKRPSTSPEDLRSLMEQVYARFERYALLSGGYAKYIGDALMLVRELPNGHNCGTTLEFLRKSFVFASDVSNIISNHWPRPSGFRLRMVAGHVYKRMVSKPISGRVVHNAEYIGYPVNLAQRLLYVAPSELVVCHESVMRILGAKRDGIKIEPLHANGDEHPRGVDPEDLKGLWAVKTVEGGKRGNRN